MAEMEAIFPAPKACTGPARSTSTMRVRKTIEVLEKAMLKIRHLYVCMYGTMKHATCAAAST
jgi:hypothetical protein